MSAAMATIPPMTPPTIGPTLDVEEAAWEELLIVALGAMTTVDA